MKPESHLKKLPKPTSAEVEKYLKHWETLENYTAQEEALTKLFELMPKNSLLSDILLKAATLNDFYSTNIFSIYSMAKRIHGLNIDARLASGDATLVDDIKRVEINGEKRNFYSFATKYCCHHNPDDFPIYDSFVEKVLMHFKCHDEFSTFEKEELKNYSRFKEVLFDFQKFYHLEKYNLRQLDRYLWLVGKAFFPK